MPLFSSEPPPACVCGDRLRWAAALGWRPRWQRPGYWIHASSRSVQRTWDTPDGRQWCEVARLAPDEEG